MFLSNGGVKLARRAAGKLELPIATLPAFLCPAILNRAPVPTSSTRPRRHLQTTAKAPAKREGDLFSARPLASTLEPDLISRLPLQCPGCGALSQTVANDDPGFYTLNRRSIREYFQRVPTERATRERDIFENAVSRLDTSQGVTNESKGIIGELSSAFAESSEPQIQSREPPVCDRCHNLKNHHTGVPIHHPSVQSIQNTILESPYKYNHIYHIIDAADFPMSLVPGLHKLLHLTPQRSLNRRAQTGKFYHGRKTEVSFIITRSDLLAPTKEHVNKLMPYLQSVLRDALGRAAQDVRLGNVRCVSAKRQWWTKELKEEIWQRGGGGWMVGKVNVGKSQLFHEVFPKGRMGDWEKHTTISTAKGSNSGSQPVKDAADFEVQKPLGGQVESTTTGRADGVVQSFMVKSQKDETITPFPDSNQTTEKLLSTDQDSSQPTEEIVVETENSSSSTLEFDSSAEPLDANSLLPPLPSETSYPAMPLVSSLPGTTASPIRISFGNGKGELIDLPGLSRGDFENNVEPRFREALVMRSRVVPTQFVLKPGQSLLLGGIIRITPTTRDLFLLSYNFTRLTPHQTSTAKAIGVQTRTIASSTENISLPGTEAKIASAGKFYLKYDVTKVRTGPVTRNDAAGIKVDRLPFRVLGTDILIEGVGWIELAAQVRKPRGHLEREKADSEDVNDQDLIDPSWPEVEISSPEGKFIGQRRPMNAWVSIRDGPGKRDVKARPRKAMKGMKKMEKMRARA